jgi:hypothetical protein
MDVDGR